MDQNLAIDGNTKNTLGAVTNDANAYIRRLLVNPVTGALLCEANVTSSNTMIGSTIPGGVEGSVLFIGPGGTLAQDNGNFFWDDTDHFLGLGTDTPGATLDVEGTFRYVDGSQQNGYVLISDGSGNATWASPGGSVSGITSINGDSTPAQTLSDASGGYIDIVDDMSGGHTFGIDIAGLTSDSTFVTDTGNSLISDTTFLNNLATNTTFIDDLVGNSYFTTSLANDSNFYTTLANNTAFITALTSNTTFQGDIVDIINNSGSSLTIDLATQVGTSVLPVPNGGTGVASLTAYAPLFGGTTSTASVQSGSVGTAGQVLTSNGAGSFATFQTPSGNNIIALDTTSNSTSGYSYTIPIPGGILGTSNSFRYTPFVNTCQFGSGQAITFTTTYGGTIISTTTITNTAGGAILPVGATFVGYVYSGGTTGSQTGYTTFGATIFTGFTVQNGSGTASVDSTVSQDLVVTVTAGGASGINCSGILVEKIS